MVMPPSEQQTHFLYFTFVMSLGVLILMKIGNINYNYHTHNLIEKKTLVIDRQLAQSLHPRRYAIKQ